jgi:hypothetical protein
MLGEPRGRVAAAALLVTVAGLLVACNPEPGGGELTVSGAVEAENPPGSVTCREPGDGGETLIPTWEWSGTIDGEPANLGFSSQSAHTPTDGALVVGDRMWLALGGITGGEVVVDRIDADGTLHVTATLPPGPGSGPDDVDVTASLRCPGWGHSVMSGDLAGTLDGLPRCTGSGDPSGTVEVHSANLDGQLRGDFFLLEPGGNDLWLRVGVDGQDWFAMDENGVPQNVTVWAQDEDRIVFSATLRPRAPESPQLPPWGVLPGEAEFAASVRCS